MIIIHYFSIVVSFSPPINLNKNTNPINRFTTSTKCACPKPGPGFQTSYVVGGFLCSARESERCLIVLLILVELLTITVFCLFCWYLWNYWPSLFIVCFVNIGGIVDHHCLLFVLLILVELLTIIIYCLFCWYWWNCWRSLFIYFLFIISNGYEKNIHMTKDQFKYIHSAPNMSTMQSHYNL